MTLTEFPTTALGPNSVNVTEFVPEFVPEWEECAVIDRAYSKGSAGGSNGRDVGYAFSSAISNQPLAGDLSWVHVCREDSMDGPHSARDFVFHA